MAPSFTLEPAAPSTAFGAEYLPALPRETPFSNHTRSHGAEQEQTHSTALALVSPLQGCSGYHQHPPQPLQEPPAAAASTTNSALPST